MTTIGKQLIVTVAFVAGAVSYNLMADGGQLIGWLVIGLAYGAVMAFASKRSGPLS